MRRLAAVLTLALLCALSLRATYTSNPVVYQARATVTATGASTSAQSLIGTGAGSTTIPANFFYAAGVGLVLEAGGYYSSGTITTQTLTITFKLGSTTILASSAFTPITSVTNGVWQVRCVIQALTVGSSGTVQPNCSFNATGSALTPGDAAMVNTSAVTLNTTVTQAATFTATWGGSPTSSQTITSTQFSLSEAYILGGTTATPSLQAVDAGTNQTGTSVTSVQTAGVATTTGWTAIVETRVQQYTATISAPTVSGATATCTLAAGSNSSSLDLGGPLIELAVCPITAGNATTKVTCNFTSQAYDSCVVMYFNTLTGTADTSQFSSAYASSTTNNLGTNTFTTTHSSEVVAACMSYAANNLTFSAGSIAGSGATLGETSGSTSSGDTGCEYLVLSTTVSSQNASLNLSGSSSYLEVNMVAVY